YGLLAKSGTVVPSLSIDFGSGLFLAEYCSATAPAVACQAIIFLSGKGARPEFAYKYLFQLFESLVTCFLKSRKRKIPQRFLDS
ncbi:MAG: hypothetical protein ACKOEO_04510, partial [Planctomycetaceae bacterium]